MKYLIIILFFVAGSVLSAQAIADSLKNKEMNQEQNQFRNKEMNQERNQIGAKENPENGKQNKERKMDVFIDKDGDGICDNRQSGMSFNKVRNRKGAGQKGPGGPGQGNNSGNGHSGNR